MEAPLSKKSKRYSGNPLGGVAREIVTRRFYAPVKDLLTELRFRPTNKATVVGEGITIKDDEEQSLDKKITCCEI
jgi:hypothetical protein